MLLRSRCATSMVMSFQSFFSNFFYLSYNFKIVFTNFRIIINLHNKSQPTSYLFTSTINPNPRPFQLKGKTRNSKPWNPEGFCMRSTTWGTGTSNSKQIVWISPTFQFYSYTSFQGQTYSLNFYSMVSHHLNLRKPRESKTMKGRNLIPFETVKISPPYCFTISR